MSVSTCANSSSITISLTDTSTTLTIPISYTNGTYTNSPVLYLPLSKNASYCTSVSTATISYVQQSSANNWTNLDFSSPTVYQYTASSCNTVNFGTSTCDININPAEPMDLIDQISTTGLSLSIVGPTDTPFYYSISDWGASNTQLNIALSSANSCGTPNPVIIYLTDSTVSNYQITIPYANGSYTTSTLSLPLNTN